jgi:hypothetical protein
MGNQGVTAIAPRRENEKKMIWISQTFGESFDFR